MVHPIQGSPVPSNGMTEASRVLGPLLVFLLLCGMSGRPVHGQGAAQPAQRWASLVPKGFDKKEYSRLELAHKDIVAGKVPLTEGSKKDFLKYYTQTFMLMTDPGQLLNLPLHQGNLMADLSKAPEDVRAAILGNTIKIMDLLAAPNPKRNLHPSVRYTAVLILGQLNEREEKSGGDASQAVPYAAARPLLIKHFDDPQQLDSVRLGAMVGLLRHSQLHAVKPNMKGESENEIRTRMLTLVTTKKAPEGRSDAGHDWMRRRATDILAALGFKGETGAKCALGLIDIILDDAEPMSIRCAAAAALGSLGPKTFPAASSKDPVAMSKQLGKLAFAICKEEIMRIDQELSKGIGGMGGGFSAAPMMMDDDDMMFRRQSQRRRDPGASGGRGAGPNPATVVDDTDPRIDRLRRILRFRLACIQSALAGTKTGGGLVGQVATDAQKAEVDRVITAIVSVVEVIDRGNSDLSALLKSITDRANTALQDIDKVVAAK